MGADSTGNPSTPRISVGLEERIVPHCGPAMNAATQGNVTEYQIW
jgi:hypothetical protein